MNMLLPITLFMALVSGCSSKQARFESFDDSVCSAEDQAWQNLSEETKEMCLAVLE